MSLTTFPPLKSIAGIRIIVLQADKIFQHFHSRILAFLRVKLAAENIMLPNHGRKVGSVITIRQDDVRRRGPDKIRVHKINKGTVLDSLCQRTFLIAKLKLIPSHMRDFESL